MTARLQNSSPFLSAGRLSRFLLGWISPLLTQARQQGTLHITDLYDLPMHLESTALTDELEANWLDEIRRNPEKPSFLRATLRTMRWKPLLFGLILVPRELLNIAQPIFLVFLMDFFEPCSTMPAWHAWLLAFGIVFTTFCSTIIFNYCYYRTFILALQMRLAYSGLVFRKVLRLSSHSLNTISSGEITNIFSNDVGQIELALMFCNYIWISPLVTILVIFLLWYFIKYVALLVIGYTLVILVIQAIFGRLFLRIRNKTVKVTDERVKIMSEVIKSMRVIKMYCWESAIVKQIRRVRKREIIQYGCRFMLDCIQMLFSQTYISVAFLLLYASLWALNIQFSSHIFAVASCLLAYMRLAVVDSFSFAVKDLVHYFSAQKRIQAFLLLEEIEGNNRLLSHSPTEFVSINQDEHTIIQNIQTRSPRVECNLKQAQWEKSGTFCLKNIVFDAQPGDLICIIGPVGAGKSSLLQALLGEIAFCDGIVQLDGSFCYAPQEAWIFPSTLENNILFGKEYDQQLFECVVQATALDLDFTRLPYGPNTLVGDQGVMLSGGQKARVNLARALYRNADIYLLDDPLSAVDSKVAKHLFEKSIKGYLRDKICILVTHQIQFLQDASKIIVLNNGEVLESGTYNDLLSLSSSFSHLLNDIHQHESDHSADFHDNESMTKSTPMKKEHEISTVSTTTESKQEGTVKWRVYGEYLRAGAGIIVGIFLVFVVSSVREATYVFSNWWLATWNEDEHIRHHVLNNCTTNLKNNTIWYMTDAEWINYRNRLFYIYIVIVAVVVLISFFHSVVLELMFVNAARVLHNKMFQRLIRAPIDFFDSNPVGRILNRFTKDVFIMDNSMPEDVFSFVDCSFRVLGVICLVGYINVWSFIPAGLCVGGLLFVRYRYAPSSRALKRLEGTTRSPVYSHLSSTVHGLKVIRSYSAENVCSDDFHLRLDDNTRANHLIIVTNRWAAMRFDWVAFVFIALITLLAMVLRVTDYHHISSVQIALILSNSFSLMTILQWTVRESVVIETQMTSVERILDYCSLDQEPSAKVSYNLQAPAGWPSYGQIVFDNVSMQHSRETNSPLGLSHVSMTIRAGEKVGIVGRTGAGKSSLIQTLFRMGTLVHGQIIIDDIDIASIGLDDVRSRISIIPQDPVLFTGTIRENLDPFNDYSDDEIWHALEQVQLKTLVAQDMLDGLQSNVNENGSNLSVGQKQLVCLARAVMKKRKILVIDEATANVDNVTDELIQRTIRENFKECTVLTVAHRLRTVIDSDRILVLDHGELIEFDAPAVLLSNPSSYFTALVEQTGSAEGEHLRTLAFTT